VHVSDAFAGPLARTAGVRADVAKFLRAISARDTLAAATHFGAFQAPVLIAWSRDDRFFPLAHAQRLQADFPHAELCLIDDAYTFSPLDNPAALAAAMNDFFKRHP
jgi:pimeloyl-ACP methyl ester carboxylesterase